MSFTCSHTWLCELAREWGEHLLGFTVSLRVQLRKGLQPAVMKEQLCSCWALDISGLMHQDVKES